MARGEESEKKGRNKKTRTALIVALATVVSLPVFVSAFLVKTFKHPSGSMLPTIAVRGRVFAMPLGAAPKRG